MEAVDRYLEFEHFAEVVDSNFKSEHFDEAVMEQA